jgi:hypothetical protein
VSQPGGNIVEVTDQLKADPSGISAVAVRLAGLLGGGAPTLSDGEGSELEWADQVVPRPLEVAAVPVQVWAVDGGQALVADARCLSVVATRSATVCFEGGACGLEQVGPLRAYLLGMPQPTGALADIGLVLEEGRAVDVNLLRDWGEWQAARAAVETAEPGSLVLVDGDLVADWRIPSSTVTDLLTRASRRGVGVVGVTKHSSLARGGAPLVGQLELEAQSALGRCCWWAPVGRTRPGSHWPDLQVVIAKLDPDARYAFRVDLPAAAEPADLLGALTSVCNDAAFPGYPYPLSVADRLAACPGWVRAEAWLALDEALEAAGVASEVRERAFDDRHRLMERA